jgi:phosphatidate cytidylyltransferase
VSSLTKRILSAIVLVPIVALAAWFGHPWWDLLVVLFGGVMTWEWCRIAGRRADPEHPGTRREPPSAWPETVIATALVAVGLFALGFPEFVPHILDLRLALVLAVLITLAVAWPRHGRAALWFGLGVAYIAIPCAAIIALRGAPEVGLAQILWVVGLVIFADTGAYIAGRSIGGPKLAPRISPNKTWAGLGGAIIAAAIAGSIAAALLGQPSPWPLALLSGALAVLEQAGDLAESAFKRHFGVKDAGHIIPGHGGALDRVDGLIAVAAGIAVINDLVGSSVLTWL